MPYDKYLIVKIWDFKALMEISIYLEHLLLMNYYPELQFWHIDMYWDMNINPMYEACL